VKISGRKISDIKVSHHKTKQSPVRFCCVVWVDLREKKLMLLSAKLEHNI